MGVPTLHGHERKVSRTENRFVVTEGKSERRAKMILFDLIIDELW